MTRPRKSYTTRDSQIHTASASRPWKMENRNRVSHFPTAARDDRSYALSSQLLLRFARKPLRYTLEMGHFRWPKVGQAKRRLQRIIGRRAAPFMTYSIK